MKTKLYILFLLMFSMNISCLKEGPHISFESKISRLSFRNAKGGWRNLVWRLKKFYRNGEDVTALVVNTDTLCFDLKFYNQFMESDIEFIIASVIYPLMTPTQVGTILTYDPYFCRRNNCMDGVDARYRLFDHGRKMEFKFQYAGISPLIIDTVNIRMYRIGFEKVDNTRDYQLLQFDVLRLTDHHLVLGWNYRNNYYRMEFAPYRYSI